MANTYPIQFKRSSISGKIPSANSLSVGELALNFPDRIIYSKDATGNVISFADISIDAFYQANTAHDKINVAFVTANTAHDKINVAFVTANTAHDKINVAFVQANSAHSQANLAFDKINVAFTTANTAHDKINVAFTKANTAHDKINVAFVTANTAHDKINVAFVTANTAHDKINVAFVTANTAHDKINVTFVTANTAHDKINVAFTTANTAHDKINVAFVQANTSYSQANLAFAQANAAYSHSNLSIVLGNTILTLGSVNTSITGLNSISSNNINSNTIILNENTIFCNTILFTSGTQNQNLDSFLVSQFRSCKYLIQVQFEDNYLTENGQGVITEDGIDIVNQRLYQVSEILLLHDNDISYITEYGYMSTGNTLATFSTTVSGGKILLQVSPTFINTKIKYTRSTIA